MSSPMSLSIRTPHSLRPPVVMINLGTPPESTDTELRCLVSAVATEPSLLPGMVPSSIQLQTELTQFVALGPIIQQSTKRREDYFGGV